MSSPVKVQIFGQTYTIHGELDPAYVQKLATFVDEKMRVISDATSTVDTHKIAVLAAMIIVICTTWLVAGASIAPLLRDPRRARVVNAALAAALVGATALAVLH